MLPFRGERSVRPVPMKKIILEVLVSAAVVLVPTYFIYGRLSGVDSFWRTQSLWSFGLAVLWMIVAAGYYHQGWLVRRKRRADDVSIALPVAVFFVQCILFVKGIYYSDWALVFGALIVNSGVVFSLSQIMRFRNP